MIVIHPKRKMAVDKLRGAFSRIEKLQAIRKRTAFEHHARRRPSGVRADVDARAVFQPGAFFGYGLVRIVDRPIQCDFVIRNANVNCPALRGHHGLPLDRGVAFGAERHHRVGLQQALGSPLDW